MMGLLSPLLAALGALSWKTYGLLGVLAGGLALWLWIAGLRADLALLRGEKAELGRQLTLQKTLLAERERALDVLAETERLAARLQLEAQTAREEAIHAQKEDDGPLAPVLRRAFERLR